MKTKLFLLFAGLFSLIASSKSQTTNIQGKVIDKQTNLPIQYANVTLLNNDSIFLNGTSCDENGIFSLPGFQQDNNILSASFIGYKTCYYPLSDKENNLVEIKLESSDINLEEISVTAKSYTNKGDRISIIPTGNQIKTSSDAVDLLAKLQLSQIMVDRMSGEIMVSGNGELQLRINGVLVTYAEISSLNPQDVLRIEYHDNPGVRYGNASAVINYITRLRNTGGNIRGGAFHNIGGDRTSIDDMLSGRYTQGKSEFTGNLRFIQRKGDWTREYYEKFIFPDKELHRKEIGEPTLFNKKVLNSNISYSLKETGKYFFNTQLRYSVEDFPAGYEDRKSKLYSSDSNIFTSIYDHTTEKNHSPAVDIYYERNFKNNKLLIFNLVGTYINSKNKRIYQEKTENIFDGDFLSDISGKKYSMIAEAIYEKTTGKNKFTGGMKHFQSFTNNKYKGTIDIDVALKQSESFIYGEYQGKLNNWGYTANVILSRFYYSQADNHNTKYAIQPSLLISYSPTEDLIFRYHINLKNNTPSIAYLNDVEQTIDNLQIRRGNPSLKSYRSVNQDFRAAYNKKLWSIDALVTYKHEINPIMESVLYEDGIFVKTYDNQKSFQNLTAEITLKIKPWKDHINLSVTPAINRYISKGNNYLHTYTMKELRINLDAYYKNWIMSFMTITPPNRYVYGEQLMKGDLMHTIMVGYKMPAWSVMAGIHNPFIRTYRSENENWSALNPVKSDIHSKNMSRTFVVKVNFNLNFGKQSKAANKAIINMDNDSGIMSGTKN